MRGLELHLLLPDFSLPAKVSRVTHLQSPSTIVSQKLCQLHGQLSHVVLTLIATCFVKPGTIGCFSVCQHGTHAVALFAQPVVLL
eukprot:Skav202855  [mRNA]  locus=scaffold2311:203250:203504:- [translate_table: standard]